MGACKSIQTQLSAPDNFTPEKSIPIDNNIKPNTATQSGLNTTHSNHSINIINEEIPQYQILNNQQRDQVIRQAVSEIVGNQEQQSEKKSFIRLTDQGKDAMPKISDSSFGQIKTEPNQHKTEQLQISHDYLQSKKNLGKQEKNKIQ
ncbi:unnamed protein product [Paramecium sonneborni]|uniref:Uncharacterized protein n=1 Tax=Paramecium sonneborni TaxID=65129 RepID=A0A8S1QPV3_9CILI|nr:unnamed protein product [Paramecium sonneborni]